MLFPCICSQEEEILAIVVILFRRPIEIVITILISKDNLKRFVLPKPLKVRPYLILRGRVYTTIRCGFLICSLCIFTNVLSLTDVYIVQNKVREFLYTMRILVTRLKNTPLRRILKRETAVSSCWFTITVYEPALASLLITYQAFQ
jgi:hypothetical protein